MTRSRWMTFVHIAAMVVLMGAFAACTEEKTPPPSADLPKTTVDAASPAGPGTVWYTPLQSTPVYIRFTTPSTVPSPFNRIDLSQYRVMFLPVYPAVVDTTGGDTLKPGVPILIMNVQRSDTLTQQLNNYIGIGVAEQPVPLTTTQFLPVIPPGGSN